MDLDNFVVNPVTLALLILGLVEFIKKFGVSGNKLTVISMVVGILFALIYKAREFILPSQPYIDIAFFGLAAGLCASGIYSFVNNRFPPQTKATLKYTKIVQSGSPTSKESFSSLAKHFRSTPIQLSGSIGEDAILGVSIATTGEALGHGLMFDQTTLFQLQHLAASKAGGIKSRFTHPDWFHDGLGKYLGKFQNFRIDGEKLVADLLISKSAHTSPAGNIAQYVLDLAREDPAALGVSVVVDIDRYWITADGQEKPAAAGKPANAVGKFPVARMTGLYAADLVDEPALNPDGLFEAIDPQQGALGHLHDLGAAPCNSQEGESQDMTDQPISDRVTRLEATIDKLSSSVENSVIQIGSQPPRGQQLSQGAGARDQFAGYFDWLFGAPGAKLPPPELRRADALYRAVTGDVEMRGLFDPSHVAFAAATTTTLADLAVNAMNKVVLDLYTNLTAYRWYELITSVQATDGSLQDMQWLQFGGISNLPVVAEGAAYTELTVVDTKETGAFTKYGGYVGITDKMLRNSQIDRLQAIPRALTISAIRTRSAAIAAIFTQAAGLGPTRPRTAKPFSSLIIPMVITPLPPIPSQPGRQPGWSVSNRPSLDQPNARCSGLSTFWCRPTCTTRP